MTGSRGRLVLWGEQGGEGLTHMPFDEAPKAGGYNVMCAGGPSHFHFIIISEIKKKKIKNDVACVSVT